MYIISEAKLVPSEAWAELPFAYGLSDGQAPHTKNKVLARGFRSRVPDYLA